MARLSSASLLVLAALALAAALPPAALRAQDNAPSPKSQETLFPRAAWQAERDGYRLIGAEELRALLLSDEPPLLVDTRPDYEFAQGHPEGALHMPFEPGEAHGIAPDKQTAVLALLGPDKERTVVVYCRSPQ